MAAGPCHIDATGEDGRGTLLVALAGWRRWVLGSWKIPTERVETILPRLRSVVERFGAPRAIMRDLGRAMIPAAADLVAELKLTIPVLACHQHILADIGKDPLKESYGKCVSRSAASRFVLAFGPWLATWVASSANPSPKHVRRFKIGSSTRCVITSCPGGATALL